MNIFILNNTFATNIWEAISAIGTIITAVISLSVTIIGIVNNNPQKWLKIEKSFLSIEDCHVRGEYYKLKLLARLKNIGKVGINIKKVEIYLTLNKTDNKYSLYFRPKKTEELHIREIRDYTFIPLHETATIQSSLDIEDFINSIQKKLKKAKQIKGVALFYTNIGIISYKLSQKEIELSRYALDTPNLVV